MRRGVRAAMIAAVTEWGERAMGGWGCPHEIGGKCIRIRGFDCDPGMKGCVLFGRFRFSNDDKNRGAKASRPAGRRLDDRASEDRQPDTTKPTRPSSR